MKRDRLGITFCVLLAVALALLGSALCPQMCLADGPLVIDTFSRGAGPDLGTTEDANHFPWFKPPSETKASISADQKLVLEQGIFTGVAIDNFRPGDFDMTLMFSLTNQAGWAGFVYRSEVKDGCDGQDAGNGRGYIFHVGGAGAHDVLYIWSGQTGHIAAVTTGLDWTTPHKVRLRVVGDHHQVWLDDAPDPIVDVHNGNNTNPGYFFFVRLIDGATYDDLNIQSLDTFGTVSGTVRNANTNAPVAGAKVTIQDTVVLTGADGKYTASNIVSGTRPISVLADGYFAYSGTVEVQASAVVTRDVALNPLPAPKVVTDSFTREDSTDLGTTEDAGHYPWIKSVPSSATGIVSQSLYFPEGSGDAVTLGGFFPADFELTASWNSGSTSVIGYSGISYRGTTRGGEDPAGYSLRIDPDMGDLFLRGHGVQLATANVPWTQVDFYDLPGPEVKIRAVGNHHQVWVEGVKYIDYIDTDAGAKGSGGYMTMFRNGMYITADDFVLNSYLDSAAGDITGTVTSGGSPVVGAEVSIVGIASTATDAAGHYEIIGVVPGSHTVTASFPGYETASMVVSVPEGNSATQDFVLAPLPPGVITDTFSRDDNVDLGTTEDSSHTLWVKGPDPDTTINVSERSLSLGYPYGHGAGLAGIRLQDFELEFDVWITQPGPYSMVEYRIPVAVGANEGTRNDTQGFQLQIQTVGVQYLWSGETGHIGGANTGVTNWTVPHHFRVRAVGKRHQAWQDGVLLWDVSSDKNVAPGAIAFLHYGQGTRYDNIRLTPITASSVPTVDALMELPDGTPVELQSAVVTGKIPLVGFWYVEDPDRSNGIKLVGPTTAVAGDVVKVVGEMATQNGERHIKVNAASDVTILSSGTPPKPLFVRGADLDAPGGLGVTGLLITVAGKVTTADVNFMEITDGSGTNQWIWHEDLGTSNPSVGDFVVLTGEAGKWDGNRSILWMRSPSDLMKVAP